MQFKCTVGRAKLGVCMTKRPRHRLADLRRRVAVGAALIAMAAYVPMALGQPSHPPQGPKTAGPNVAPDWITYQQIERKAEQEANAAFKWGLYSTLVPIGAATLLTATFPRSDEPGQPTEDIATWQVASFAGLWAVGGLWGPSAGYYRGGMSTYATVAGLTKTALAGLGPLLDVTLLFRNNDEGGIPLFTMLSLGAVLTWDVFDLARVRKNVRRHVRENMRNKTHPQLRASRGRASAQGFNAVPVMAPTKGGGYLGMTGTF